MSESELHAKEVIPLESYRVDLPRGNYSQEELDQSIDPELIDMVYEMDRVYSLMTDNDKILFKYLMSDALWDFYHKFYDDEYQLPY